VRGYIESGLDKSLIANSVLSAGNLNIVFAGTSTSYTANLQIGSIYEANLPAGTYPRPISLDGFMSGSSNVIIQGASDETTANNIIFVVPKIQGWTAILRWGTSDKDLDISTILPDGTKVYYNKKISSDGKVTLDTDSRDGSGPETMSLKGITSGIYAINASNYSKEMPIAQTGTFVELYHDNSQVATIYAATAKLTDPKSMFWYVVEINASTNSYNLINEIR